MSTAGHAPNLHAAHLLGPVRRHRIHKRRPHRRGPRDGRLGASGGHVRSDPHHGHDRGGEGGRIARLFPLDLDLAREDPCGSDGGEKGAAAHGGGEALPEARGGGGIGELDLR